MQWVSVRNGGACCVKRDAVTAKRETLKKPCDRAGSSGVTHIMDGSGGREWFGTSFNNMMAGSGASDTQYLL